jgi:hypothetical protein
MRRWICSLSGIIYIVSSFVIFISLLIVSKLNLDNLWSNFLLNFATEIIGLAIGTMLAFWLASRFAKEKLKELALPIIEIITELRERGKISEKGARNCVICAVNILSEDSFYIEKPQLSILTNDESCKVCNLKAKTTSDKLSCKYCHLHISDWRKAKNNS